MIYFMEFEKNLCFANYVSIRKFLYFCEISLLQIESIFRVP